MVVISIDGVGDCGGVDQGIECDDDGTRCDEDIGMMGSNFASLTIGLYDHASK